MSVLQSPLTGLLNASDLASLNPSEFVHLLTGLIRRTCEDDSKTHF